MHLSFPLHFYFGAVSLVAITIMSALATSPALMPSGALRDSVGSPTPWPKGTPRRIRGCIDLWPARAQRRPPSPWMLEAKEYARPYVAAERPSFWASVAGGALVLDEATVWRCFPEVQQLRNGSSHCDVSGRDIPVHPTHTVDVRKGGSNLNHHLQATASLRVMTCLRCLLYSRIGTLVLHRCCPKCGYLNGIPMGMLQK